MPNWNFSGFSTLYHNGQVVDKAARVIEDFNVGDNRHVWIEEPDGNIIETW